MTTVKELISNRFFEGERPLFAMGGIRLENVKFYPGESPVKHGRNIEACGYEFMSKYPFWHNENVVIENCLFTVYSRAAIWYSRNVRMTDCVVEAPKMFREIDGLYLENVKLPNAGETLWNCRDMTLRNVEAKGGDYIFMNGKNIDIDGFRLQGNYSFQDAQNVTIRNAVLDSKGAQRERGLRNQRVCGRSVDGCLQRKRKLVGRFEDLLIRKLPISDRFL